MTIEIKDNEIEALKWLTLKGMEMTHSNQKFEVFQRLSDIFRDYKQASVESEVKSACGDCENYSEYDNGMKYCSNCGSKLNNKSV